MSDVSMFGIEENKKIKSIILFLHTSANGIISRGSFLEDVYISKI